MSDQSESHGRNQRTYELIRTLMNGVMVDACSRHYDCETQEHQLSSRLAEAIERTFDGLRVNDLNIRVAVQELSDRGPSSHERPVGADLYISVVVDDGDNEIRKGMLVQAKWDGSLRRSPERAKLREQSERMLGRSRESYVWVYEPRGVAVVRAARAMDAASPTALTREARTLGDLLVDGLSCTAGDPAIGIDTSLPLVEALNSRIRELAATTGLSFAVIKRE